MKPFRRSSTISKQKMFVLIFHVNELIRLHKTVLVTIGRTTLSFLFKTHKKNILFFFLSFRWFISLRLSTKKPKRRMKQNENFSIFWFIFCCCCCSYRWKCKSFARFKFKLNAADASILGNTQKRNNSLLLQSLTVFVRWNREKIQKTKDSTSKLTHSILLLIRLLLLFHFFLVFMRITTTNSI